MENFLIFIVQSKNFIKRNVTLSLEKKAKIVKKIKLEIKRRDSPKKQVFSYGELLVSSLKKKETPQGSSKNNQKKEVYDFYIELLRKLELVKFTTNNKNLKENEMRLIILRGFNFKICLDRFQY